MVCKLVLVACWRASTPLHIGFCTRLTSWHCNPLPPEQLIQGVKEEASVLCMTLSCKSHTVTSTLLYWSHRPALIHCGRRLHREINARRQRSWGPFGDWPPQSVRISLEQFFRDLASQQSMQATQWNRVSLCVEGKHMQCTYEYLQTKQHAFLFARFC